jgi:hypothetical protein
MIRHAVIAGVISLGIALAPFLASPPSELNCYLVQMHLHGHSNHNGSIPPASMEWHCYHARSHGFDVVWWTDHAEIFGEYDDIRVALGNTTFEEESNSVILMAGRTRRRLSRLNLESSAENFTVDTAGQSLRISLTSGGGEHYERLRLTPASRRGPVKTVDWCRPVSSGLRIEIVLDVTGLGKDSYLRFGFDLGAHPEGQHHLRFDVVPGQDSEPEVSGDTLVVQRLGAGGFPSRLVFDLERAAALLPDGDDNTLSSLFMEFGVRYGGTMEVAVDSLVMVSSRPSGENQYRVMEKLVERYESRYGITQYIGVEIGGIHTPRLPHMNAFYPDSTEAFENLVVDPEVTRAEWAEDVHRRGGIVSLNHPYGAALNPSARGLDADRETASLRDLAAAAGPIPEQDLWKVAEPIIETGGLGCDVLEVGYLFRGSGSLNDHLRLWDLVLAHGIRLVGNGVSDSHGGVWGAGLRPNPFASWVWAPDKDRNSLLYALRAGRVCFGNPFLFACRFAFGIEGAFMGDTLYVSPGHEATGWVYLEPWQDGLDFRIVQVKMEAGREPVYIRRHSLSDIGDGFEIQVEDTCFARVEVYGQDGEPLVFSNPVWLIPE